MGSDVKDDREGESLGYQRLRWHVQAEIGEDPPRIQLKLFDDGDRRVHEDCLFDVVSSPCRPGLLRVPYYHPHVQVSVILEGQRPPPAFGAAWAWLRLVDELPSEIRNRQGVVVTILWLDTPAAPRAFSRLDRDIGE